MLHAYCEEHCSTGSADCETLEADKLCLFVFVANLSFLDIAAGWAISGLRGAAGKPKRDARSAGADRWARLRAMSHVS